MNSLQSVMQVSNEHFESDSVDLLLADEVSKYYADPYGFIMMAFDWGHGDLFGFDGPDMWQTEVLQLIGDEVSKRKFDGVNAVDPIQLAVASGHGIGKSALSAWLMLWVMSTRPHSKGVVTANTGDQLKTKTMSELAKWARRCITGHWFEVNAMSITHRAYSETWRVDALTSREEASESFAGLHAADSTPWYLFDESCHDDRTEVMTDSGWKLFADVVRSDKLLTMDPNTQQSYFDHAQHLHVADYDGDMIHIRKKGCDFKVTPNHRMLYYSAKQPDVPKFSEAGDMVWSNKSMLKTVNMVVDDISTFTIPGYTSRMRDYPERVVDMDVWLSVLGWFITDGSYQLQNDKPSTVTFYQKKPHSREVIKNLLTDIGIVFSENWQGFTVSDPALCNELSQCGKGFDRKVPEYVFSVSPRQMTVFIDAVVGGDGYEKDGTQIIYTSNEYLASAYHALILLSGYTSVDSMRSLKGVTSHIDGRAVTSTRDGHVVTRSKSLSNTHFHNPPTRVHYTGKVYCATVSGGVLFTRRNGVPIWSGNSAIPEKIWEVAKGGLTDGEPMHFAFGNPTRNTGSFFECFRRQSHRWITRQIDSRTAKMTNKSLIKKWIDDYGEDSDFVRVRVKGVFPKGGDMQFIPSDVVYNAQKRGPGMYMGDDPLICGIDLARGGDDNCMIGFRRGKDAKSEKTYKITGEKSRDSMKVVSLIVMVLDRHKPDVTFLDVTGLGGPIGDRLRQLGYHVIDVGFGHTADDEILYSNKTAEMGARCRDWLMSGGAIPDDPQLEVELTSRDFGHNDKDQLVLERKKDMKKRLGVSPDWADQLYLTFAHAVPKREQPRGRLDADVSIRDSQVTDYDPLAVMDMD